ncbi:hypothetical protein GY45DRAFT_1264799, partial [Cubamyces sp. BRFM 1775]
MQYARKRSKPRKISPWNAFVSQEVKKLNEGLDGDNRQRLSPELVRELAARWKEMTPEEKSAAVGDGVDKLSERQEMRQHGMHNVPINAFNDIRASLDSVSQQLDFLNGRTGVDVLLIAVRRDPEQFNNPFVFYTNERIAQFLGSATGRGETVQKFAMRLEAACIGGLDEVARSHHSEVLQLKAQVRDLIEAKLKQACTRGKIERMFYVNFDEHITMKYGIVIEGWPFPDKFIAPGKFSSIAELRVLLAAWESGTTYFRSMSNSEWREW